MSGAQGRDGTDELAGLVHRLGLRVGPRRYLLVSVTYGTKSYPSGLPTLRERQVGLDVGLNLAIFLEDLGVRRNTWQGYALHVIGDNVRVSFTAVGVRYEMNSQRWRGPDNDHSFATP